MSSRPPLPQVNGLLEAQWASGLEIHSATAMALERRTQVPKIPLPLILKAFGPTDIFPREFEDVSSFI